MTAKRFNADQMLRLPPLVVVLVLSALPASSAMAAVGSPLLMTVERRIADARKNPERTVERFRKSVAESDERFVLFMLSVRLGEEKRISTMLTRWIISQGMIDVDGRVRSHSVHYLDEVYDGEKLQALYRRCTLDKSHVVRYNAVEQLAQTPSEEAAPYLFGLLSDEYIEVRSIAAGTLSGWNMPRVHEKLRQAANSHDIRRAGAASVAIALQAKEEVDAGVLNRYLDSELSKQPPFTTNGMVVAIIRVLATCGDKSSLPVLERVIEREPANVGSQTEQRAYERVQRAAKEAIESIRK